MERTVFEQFSFFSRVVTVDIEHNTTFKQNEITMATRDQKSNAAALLILSITLLLET